MLQQNFWEAHIEKKLQAKPGNLEEALASIPPSYLQMAQLARLGRIEDGISSLRSDLPNLHDEAARKAAWEVYGQRPLLPRMRWRDVGVGIGLVLAGVGAAWMWVMDGLRWVVGR